MAKRYLRKMIFLLLCLFCFKAYGDEDNLPSDEYTQIFQSIPALFEYLLDVVEQRPEILETDDITVFNRKQDAGTGTRKKRSYEDNGNDNETRVNDETHQFENEEGIGKAVAVANEHGSSDIIMENNDVFDITDPKKRAVDQERITHERSTVGNKTDIPKKTEVNNLVQASGGDDKGFNMYGEDKFLGFNSLFGLNYEPEDVVEQIINIEELLEKHNNKKD